jgi:hypothetical protein
MVWVSNLSFHVGVQNLAQSELVAGGFIERELKKSRDIICTYNHYYMDTVKSINQRFEEIKKGTLCGHGHPPALKNSQMTRYCNYGHGLVIKPPVAGEPDDFLPDNDAQALQDMQVRGRACHQFRLSSTLACFDF